MKIKLKEIGKIITGKTPPKNEKDAYGNTMNFLTPSDLKGQRFSDITARQLSEKGVRGLKNNIVSGPSISVSCIGSNMGKTIFNKEAIITNQQLNSITSIRNDVNPLYLYYLLISKRELLHFIGSNQGSTMPILNKNDFGNLEFEIPSFEEQNYISGKLNLLDREIELNNQINDNLEKLNRNFFRHIFGDQKPINKASDIANIKIGKTPPRKQNQWFSFKDGYKWLSIKDMKREGAFAFYAEEHLTEKAIQKFNIQVVPQYTVMVSFKLTIGRVKISIEDMVTNEAIAQFKDSTLPYEFLYTYLDNFPFETLGSTSSIAKAINSKILKSMPILVPKAELLSRYMIFAKPIFAKIFELQNENIKLNILKETLLNKYF